MTYRVEVSSADPRFAVFEPVVTRAVRRALEAEGVPPDALVAVLLADDTRISEQHERFLGIAGATDVLSWPAGPDPFAREDSLGDVMVSCDTARRQAGERGHSWEREVCVLAVHGVLHLLGWDDATPEQQQSMQSRVDELVELVQPG